MFTALSRCPKASLDRASLPSMARDISPFELLKALSVQRSGLRLILGMGLYLRRVLFAREDSFHLSLPSCNP